MQAKLLTQFRVIGILEALSFLILLGIAMPLKHFAGIPSAVMIAGWIHGVLFVLYVGWALYVGTQLNWSNGRHVGAVAAAMLPFGPFVFHAYLRRDYPSEQNSSGTS